MPKPSEESALAVQTNPKASDQLAAFLGIEKGMMIDTLKAQCFKGKHPDEVTDTQLAAFVSTANVLQVNPLVPGMLYAYPEKNGGITPILGPDGVFKKLDEMIASGKLQGYECEVECEAGGKPIKAHATIYRSGDAKPAKYTAWFSEWTVDSNPNWRSRPRHMIWVRAIKQAARQVIHGLPMDSDEYTMSQMTNVTPESEAPKPEERPAPPARRGGAAAAKNTSAPAPASDAGNTIEAEIIPPKVEPAPAAAPAATPPAEAPVEPAPAAPAAAPATPEAPEIAPGVNMTGFHGKKWPVLLKPTVTTVKRAKTPQGTPLLIVGIKNEDGGDFSGEFVTFEHVEMKDGQPVKTADWLKEGAVIEANFRAKIRPDKTGQPDYSRPPAIYAEQVTEATADAY